MSGVAKKLLDEALALPPEERVVLADALARSVHGDVPVSAEWRAELERRLDELTRGDAELVPWSDVAARLSQR